MGPGEKGGHVRISGDGSMLGTSSWVAALQLPAPWGTPVGQKWGPSSADGVLALQCGQAVLSLPSTLSGGRHSRMVALLAQSSRSLRLRPGGGTLAGGRLAQTREEVTGEPSPEGQLRINRAGKVGGDAEGGEGSRRPGSAGRALGPRGAGLSRAGSSRAVCGWGSAGRGCRVCPAASPAVRLAGACSSWGVLALAPCLPHGDGSLSRSLPRPQCPSGAHSARRASVD